MLEGGGGKCVLYILTTTWDQSMLGTEDAGVADVTAGAGGGSIAGDLGKAQERGVLGLCGEAGPTGKLGPVP